MTTKTYAIGDSIKLDSGTVEVVAKLPIGPSTRRDVLYTFKWPVFTLTGREIELNMQRQWERAA